MRKDRQTRIHRITDAVDNSCLRHHCGQQTDTQKVVRQFIGDPRALIGICTQILDINLR